MTDDSPRPFAAFDGPTLLASGSRAEVALAVKRALDAGAGGPVLAFDSEGGQIDFDTRGSEAEVLARLAPPPAPPRGRGRPKLGVVPREVTLLPRHWDWLATQPGGASVALRKLVEAARGGEQDRRRAARDAAYRFGSAMAGDLPNFEDAMRALYAGDIDGLKAHSAVWPADVRGHLLTLLES
jgi:hypothetical protein